MRAEALVSTWSVRGMADSGLLFTTVLSVALHALMLGQFAPPSAVPLSASGDARRGVLQVAVTTGSSASARPPPTAKRRSAEPATRHAVLAGRKPSHPSTRSQAQGNLPASVSSLEQRVPPPAELPHPADQGISASLNPDPPPGAREALPPRKADTSPTAGSTPSATSATHAEQPQPLDWTPKFAPPPEYPEEARWEERVGSVALAFAITTDGGVEGVRVLASSGHRDLDLAAVHALQRWRFDSDHPVDRLRRYKYTFHFRLY